MGKYQSRPIAFIPQLVEIIGDRNATILYQQLLYWSDKGNRADRYIWKKKSEIEYETTLSVREQDRARRILVDKGLIATKLIKANGVPTLHYLVLKKIDVLLSSNSAAGTLCADGVSQCDDSSHSNMTDGNIPIYDRCEEPRTDRISQYDELSYSNITDGNIPRNMTDGNIPYTEITRENKQETTFVGASPSKPDEQAERSVSPDGSTAQAVSPEEGKDDFCFAGNQTHGHRQAGPGEAGDGTGNVVGGLYGHTEKHKEFREKTDKLLTDYPFRLKDGSIFYPNQIDYERWEITYPHVNLPGELLKAIDWLECNPSRRKTKRGIRRFISSWLSRVDKKTKKDTEVNEKRPWPHLPAFV